MHTSTTSSLFKKDHRKKRKFKPLMTALICFGTVLNAATKDVDLQIMPNGYYLFNVKADAKLLLENKDQTTIGKDILQGILIHNADTATTRFCYKNGSDLIVSDAEFSCTPHIKNTNKRISQGIISAQLNTDGFLNSVLLGSFRHMKNTNGEKMVICLTGAGINTNETIYGTIQLRYNQKKSDIANETSDGLVNAVAHTLKLSIENVKEPLSEDSDQDGIPDWFEIQYQGQLIFEDHFDDGTLDPAWVMKRTYWEESNGQLKSIPQVLPGFNYGHQGNGRETMIVLHEGNTNWTDYSYEYVCATEGVSPDLNPQHLPTGFIQAIGSNFRVQEFPASWNEPARTLYGFDMGLGDGGEGNWTLFGNKEYYIPGTGWSTLKSGEGTKFNTGNSPEINTGTQTNHVRILVKGNHMYAWVNGTFLGESNDPSNWAPYGGIALRGGSYEMMSWYDDVLVRSVGLDPNLPDAHLDYDQDGRTNLEEYQNGTSPIIPNNS